MENIKPSHLARLAERERKHYASTHPLSRRMAEEASGTFQFAVPMHWMVGQTPYPLFVERGEGGRLWDVDGIEYVDFFLGLTAAMFGHAPPAAVQAISHQLSRGISFIRSTGESIELGRELRRRYAMPFWLLFLSATDSNRNVLNIARVLTGRSRVLVFNGDFLGNLSEAMVQLSAGRVSPLFQDQYVPADLLTQTRVVEFNDVRALEQALAPRDVACVLTEPVMTNCGMVMPEPGFHEQLRAMTRETGTYLAIDETHTICAGPNGASAGLGIEADFLVLGKSLAAGLPISAVGYTEAIAERLGEIYDRGGEIGIGGTLAGNALAVAAASATLQRVMTDEAYARMERMAGRVVDDMQRCIARLGLPWHLCRLGARVTLHLRPEPPRNGSEGHAALDHELNAYFHLYHLNRGILLDDFGPHRTVSPATAEADIEKHASVFAECLDELFAT